MRKNGIDFIYAQTNDAFAEKNYKKIFLADHSLGANKVIYYLSRNSDAKIEKFLLLSPANLDYMTKNVTFK